jgi:hypothetical protein
MRPTLLEGDELLLVPLEHPPQQGDVVVVRGERGWVVHRVLTVSGLSVVTRGDACVRADRPVTLADVLYRVAAVTRDGQTLGLPPERTSLRLSWRRLRTRLRHLW